MRKLLGCAVLLVGSAGVVTAVAAGGGAEARFPLTRVYNKDFKGEDKLRAVEVTAAMFADLGIELRWDEATVRGVSVGAGISAHAINDTHELYDAVYYLTDLARLPPRLYPIYPRILLVGGLKIEDARRRKRVNSAIAFDPASGFLVVDHSHINQLDQFGGYVHAKVNFAMLVERAIEARIGQWPAAAVSALGLRSAVDDDEWVQLNGESGWSRYNGEDVAHIGLVSTLRVTPPGILFDTVRELSSGVPSDEYKGLGDASQPWWSPRHSPALDRQTILRCMFSRVPHFFDRLAGTNGARPDPILKEKTRLVLYAAFVASGGVLDRNFWTRRHPQSRVVAELTRDFSAEFLDSLEQRLQSDPSTAGVRLRSGSHQ